MNKREVAELLTMISAIDNRKVGVETVEMWHPIVEGIPQAIALEAVKIHFAESTEWLMPAHLVAASARVRARLEREARRARPALPPQVVTLDREKFERETAQALERARAERAEREEAIQRHADKRGISIADAMRELADH